MANEDIQPRRLHVNGTAERARIRTARDQRPDLVAGRVLVPKNFGNILRTVGRMLSAGALQWICVVRAVRWISFLWMGHVHNSPS
jgi:hypothetical protein